MKPINLKSKMVRGVKGRVAGEVWREVWREVWEGVWGEVGGGVWWKVRREVRNNLSYIIIFNVIQEELEVYNDLKTKEYNKAI